MQVATNLLERGRTAKQTDALPSCPIVGRAFTGTTESLRMVAFAYHKWRHLAFRSSEFFAFVNKAMPDLAPVATSFSTASALGYFKTLSPVYRGGDKLVRVSEKGIHYLHEHTKRNEGPDGLVSPKEFRLAVTQEQKNKVTEFLRQTRLLQQKHAGMVLELGDSNLIATEALKLSSSSLTTSMSALGVTLDELNGKHRYK